MSRPYNDIEVSDNFVIREFGQDIDPIELKWHRDDEDRTIEPICESNWMIQIDNELPIYIDKQIFIKRHEFHRLIKGDDSLKLKIYKHVRD